jgi:hypothetical protein
LVERLEGLEVGGEAEEAVPFALELLELHLQVPGLGREMPARREGVGTEFPPVRSVAHSIGTIE